MSGGLFSGIMGDFSSLTSFMSHPLESIMFFIGGIMLLVIVYHVIED